MRHLFNYNDRTHRSYQYDASGNVIQRNDPNSIVSYFEYDNQNRLIEVKNSNHQPIARYGYDPLDWRIWKEQYRDSNNNLLA